MMTKAFLRQGPNKKLIILLCMLALVAVLLLYSADVFALSSSDTLEELKKVKTLTEKATKTFAYLIGCVSGVIGASKFVMTQNFTSAAVAGAISIAAFKFPVLVASTALI